MKRNGFTLLELLIAISIFAMIGLASYQVLTTVIQAESATANSSDRLVRLQKIYLAISRDLVQVADRPIRDGNGEAMSPLLTDRRGYPLEFSRTGWRNPLNQPRSNLQRIAYELNGDELLRHSWSVLDRSQDSEPRTQVLISGVQEFGLRMLDHDGRWRTEWPDERRAPTQEGEEPPPALPAAIELTLNLPEQGELRWLFDLPG